MARPGTRCRSTCRRHQCRDIEVKQNDLVIATHGRAFWILDDVTPLRQLAVDLSLGATRLLAPAAAVRLRPEPFTGTPFPKDEPAAANPPFGAHLDYVLADPATEVTLTIRDAQQNVVRQVLEPRSAEGR